MSSTYSDRQPGLTMGIWRSRSHWTVGKFQSKIFAQEFVCGIIWFFSPLSSLGLWRSGHSAVRWNWRPMFDSSNETSLVKVSLITAPSVESVDTSTPVT